MLEDFKLCLGFLLTIDCITWTICRQVWILCVQRSARSLGPFGKLPAVAKHWSWRSSVKMQNKFCSCSQKTSSYHWFDLVWIRLCEVSIIRVHMYVRAAVMENQSAPSKINQSELRIQQRYGTIYVLSSAYYKMYKSGQWVWGFR